MTTEQIPTVTQPRSRASTGVPGLDDGLSGGLPTGHLYLRLEGGESHGWDLAGIDIFEVTPTE